MKHNYIELASIYINEDLNNFTSYKGNNINDLINDLSQDIKVNLIGDLGCCDYEDFEEVESIINNELDKVVKVVMVWLLANEPQAIEDFC